MEPQAENPGDRRRRPELSLSELFLQVSAALEQSATLADRHAAREQALGRPAGAAAERRAAQRAHDAATRGRELSRRYAKPPPGDRQQGERT